MSVSTHHSGLFRYSISLSAAPAIITGIIAFMRNNNLNTLVPYIFFIFFLVIASCAISYFSYRKLDSLLSEREVPSGSILFFYLVNISFVIKIIYGLVIFLQIPYALFTLALSVAISGAVLFTTLAAIATQRQLSNATKISCMALLTVLISALAIFTS